LLEASPLNFVVTPVLESSDVIESGRVIRTEPLGDTAVAPGSSITVYVSTGKTTVIVPSVVGKSDGDARNELTSLGLVVTTTTQVLAAGDPASGTVLAQSIAAGTNVAPGSSVTLTIGQADTTTTVTP
jgi:serine/threonine-protein kinase